MAIETPARSHVAEPSQPVVRGTVLARVSRLFTVGPGRAVALLPLLAVLVYLIIIPVATIVWGSFRDAQPGLPSSFTTANYSQAYGHSEIYKAAFSTVVYAVGATVLGIAVGGYLAWLTQRTDIRGKPIIYALIAFPLLLPGVLTSIAWALLLNPTSGALNHYASSWFGLHHPLLNAYSLPGMIWAQAMDNVSVPFLLLSAAMRSMDPSLEEASHATGAGGLRTITRVTIPVLRPALVACGLLLFMRAFESFEVPLVLGIPGRINVMATVVWRATSNSPNYNLAATYSVGYMILALIGLTVYYKAVPAGNRFATVTGKGFRPRLIKLGKAKIAHMIAAFVLLFLAIGLPVLAILWSSFQPFFALPSRKTFDRMNLDAYRNVFNTSGLREAFTNSLEVGIISSLIIVLLATLISWVVLRTKLPGRKVLDAVAFLPIGIPGLVFGLAVLWFYLEAPIPLYGTLSLIGVAFVAAFLPVALRGTHAAMSQFGAELEEASQASGAGWLRTFGRIVLPLMASGLIVTFIFVLSLTFKVLSVPVLLYTNGNQTVSIAIYQAFQNGQYPDLAALGVVLVVFLLLLSAVAGLLSKRLGVSLSLPID